MEQAKVAAAAEDRRFSDYISPAFYERYPPMLTLLTTYRCNAQCEQCCFESNPHIQGGLTKADMLRYITLAHKEFPALKIVVFSGGECFLLGDALFAAIGHATSLGLATRCVSNGFWGKSADRASATARRLKEAGVGEINFSTGLDHEKWVNVDAVVNAAEALVREEIFTLITVESDTEESNCFGILTKKLRDRDILEHPLINLCSNSWMPFKGEETGRINAVSKEAVSSPCDQVFENIVVTPYRKLAACCGLTLEHIPEMRLGDVTAADDDLLSELYWSQLDDLLKIWIHMDGPEHIVRTLFEDADFPQLDGVVHKCHACVILHKDQLVRERLRSHFHEHIPSVINRFLAKRTIEDIETKMAHRAVKKQARSLST